MYIFIANKYIYFIKGLFIKNEIYIELNDNRNKQIREC